MNEQQRTNRISSGLVAAISVAVVAVSGGVAWFSSQSANTPTPTNPSETIK
ncbi:MAG: spore germination protein, partial [Dolichospermum sp.]